MKLKSLEEIFRPGNIVYGHPAIGKTTALEGKLSGKFIDWDVIFNKKRDEWIANATNTKIGTKEFKKARTEILIHPEEYPEYIDFVKEYWTIAKELSQQENKALLASPHNLLKMFPEDFTHIINVEDADFIRRNMQRGGTETASRLWKEGITINNYKGSAKRINLENNEYLSDIPFNKYGNKLYFI